MEEMNGRRLIFEGLRVGDDIGRTSFGFTVKSSSINNASPFFFLFFRILDFG